MKQEWNVVCAQMRRDLHVALCSPGQVINPALFYLMITALFPIGITPDAQTLVQLSGGGIWIGALLAVLLTLESLFKEDFDDGSLQQIILSPCPLPILVLSRLFIHWLTTSGCLILITPLIALMLNLKFDTWQVIVIGLMLGTPTFSMFGAIGASLAIQLPRGNLLIFLLVLPLCIPVLVFGTSAIRAVQEGFSYNSPILWLAVIFMLSLILSPFAISGALRMAYDK